MPNLSLIIKAGISDGGAKKGIEGLTASLKAHKSVEDKILNDRLRGAQRVLNVHMQERLHAKRSLDEQLKGAQAILNVHLKEKRALDELKTKRTELNRAMTGAAVGSLPGGAMVQGLAMGGMMAGVQLGVSAIGATIDKIKEGISFAWHTGMDLYREGKKDVELRERFVRQFGVGRADEYDALSKRMGGKAGIEQSAAGEGLLQMAEAMPDFTAGMKVQADLAKQLNMGSRRTLTGEDAERLRGQMTERRASLFTRLATLRPDIDPTTMGRMLGDVASGAGARQFAAQLGLGKAAAKMFAANEAGKLGGDLSRLGLTKADLAKYGPLTGGRLKSFDMIDLVLNKRGMSEDAATAKRSKLDFQIQSIKATMGDVFSDIGAKVFSALNGPLGSSVTLAEKFKNYIGSPQGQRMIQKVADALGKAAMYLGMMIAKIPDMVQGFGNVYRAAEKMTRPIRDVMTFLGAENPIAGMEAVRASQAERARDDRIAGIEAMTDQLRDARAKRQQAAEGGSNAGGLTVNVGDVKAGVGLSPEEIGQHVGKHVERHITDRVRRSHPVPG